MYIVNNFLLGLEFDLRVFFIFGIVVVFFFFLEFVIVFGVVVLLGLCGDFCCFFLGLLVFFFRVNGDIFVICFFI